MRVTLLVNPRSGRGRAARIAETIDQALRARGHATDRITVGEAPDPDAERLAGSGAMVIVGGDGTVHHAAPRAVEARVPIYHAASGNENLFAREFSMSPSPERVLSALERGTTRFVDQGVCNGVGFLIMGSVGPDASVINRLSDSRRRPSGHGAYLRPVLAETLSPRIPQVRVWVDGRELGPARRGMVVVANSRQYALRVDPCHEAD
ncbi:MAG: diacylglycerol/lipid kinase family protein, partial [Phycisphaerales bacterium JB059]